MSNPGLPTQLDAPRLVTVAEMQRVERDSDATGHSYAQMMEFAGRAVADAIVERATDRQAPILILVGPGNNGGDGLVCARHLHAAGRLVRVYLWKRSTDPADDYENHFAKLVGTGIVHAHADNDHDWRQLRGWLREAPVVVDSLLGTGANRPIEGQLAEMLELVRTRRMRGSLTVIAVDCPSGLNCDTGALDPHTIEADSTITFAYAKVGHYLFPGTTAVGELVVADIGTPLSLGESIRTFVITEEWARQLLPRRSDNSHKGTFGKVLATVGSINYPGAAFFCCAAAARVGAGLVSGAIPAPIWQPVAGRLAEATWYLLPTGEGPEAGAIAVDAARIVGDVAPMYSAMILGCGLGQAATTKEFVAAILEQPKLPRLLIDADGLNSLAALENWPDRLPPETLLTPHPAEMGRLCGLSVAQVTEARWSLARKMAAKWNVVILLKGPYTVIAAPDGRLAVLPVATAALATAGTGDVLSGIVGGLMAQGLPPFSAACLGSWLHGQAGLRCAADIGTTGVLASDLLVILPHIITDLREHGRSIPIVAGRP